MMNPLQGFGNVRKSYELDGYGESEDFTKATTTGSWTITTSGD